MEELAGSTVVVADFTVAAVATAAAGIGNEPERLKPQGKMAGSNHCRLFCFCGASLFLARMCVLAGLP